MEKKNIVISILLTIALIALALTAGYLIGNNTNKTEEKENTKEEKTYKIEDANKLIEKYQRLFEYLFRENAYPEPADNDYVEIDEKNKGLFVLDSMNLYEYDSNNNLITNYNKSTCKDIFFDHPNTFDGEQIGEMGDEIMINGFSCIKESELAYVSYDKVNEKYKELFGKNKSIGHENYSLRATTNYAYSSYLNAFVSGDFRANSTSVGIDPIIGKAIDAKIENNELVINYQYFNITYLRDENDDFYPATINGKNKITEDELKNKSSLFDKYKEQENIYNLKITFINEDNNFVIKDIYKTSI